MRRLLLALSTFVCVSTLAFSQENQTTSVSVAQGVTVELFEGSSVKRPWVLAEKPSTKWQQDVFAWTTLPHKYIRGGLIADWTNPLTLVATAKREFPAGEFDFLLRAKSRARLLIDGEVVLEHETVLRRNADGHEEVPDLPKPIRPDHNAPPSIHRELTQRVALEAGAHEIRIESLVGGPSLRTELGELCVAVAEADEPMFRLLGADPDSQWPLTDAVWQELKTRERVFLGQLNARERRAKAAEDAEFWESRHQIARDELAEHVAVPAVKRTQFVNNAIDNFIVSKLEERSLEPLPVIADLPFLRRLSLDVIGQTPSLEEIKEYREVASPDRRSQAIDRLLDDPRWADYWVPYWQDVLAENPNILKASLNNTGPFRWWIYESFLDNKPLDQFATDLILMRGSKYRGGPAGFEMATQNDVPAANKALIVAEAFLATNMSCARCHDSPMNDVTQKQLFSIAAMLSRKAIELPKTSTVLFEEGDREPGIEVSLHTGDLILPHWPLTNLATDSLSGDMVQNASDSREWLAAIVTSPKTERFAKVMANRLWHRYLGRGLVEPLDDWTDAEPSHPRLLEFLARELVVNNYDAKHVARLILNSQTYQRSTVSSASSDHETTGDAEEWFGAATRRRLSAEQIFDSLFSIAGKSAHAEKLTMDPEGRRPIKSFLNLGTPRRAWQFSSLSNERDRPALSLPVAQSANDLLKAFGWREARQDAATVRDATMTPTQPLVLANGAIGQRLIGLSDDHAVTDLILYSTSPDQIIDSLYLSFFTRQATNEERTAIKSVLSEGFEDRVVEDARPMSDTYAWQRHAVSWSNHLHAKSSDIMLRMEARAREGDPPTKRLDADWRERMEDVLWALANNAEFVFVP